MTRIREEEEDCDCVAKFFCNLFILEFRRDFYIAEIHGHVALYILDSMGPSSFTLKQQAPKMQCVMQTSEIMASYSRSRSSCSTVTNQRL